MPHLNTTDLWSAQALSNLGRSLAEECYPLRPGGRVAEIRL